ncbi:TonB-dependent receptor [Roseibacillus persicicus]|uniref:TonB-dependent receptor domain-containing protein n=1 Tax=Roseibacillus persicicus TaxID=454148 RepID=UPI00398AA037
MRNHLHIVSLVSAASLSHLSAQAVLDPTVVTADAIVPLDEESEPAPPVTVSAEDLENTVASDLNDIFQKTPAVTVNGGRAQAQQIFVNGLESNLSNVSVDGATQGNLFHHTGNVFVEPELLKQVSVSPGAGNALQGLGALNGSVAFETKNAFDFLGEGKNFGGLSKGIYYSNGEGYKASQTLAARLGQDWGVLISGGYVDRDAYEDGNGDTVDLTDYTSQNALFKLSGRFDGGHSVDFGYEYIESETNAYDRLNISEDFLTGSGRPLGLLQRNELGRGTFTLNYGYRPETNDLVDLSVNTYYTTQSYSRETSGEEAEIDSFGFTVKNTSRWLNAHTTTYGVDFRRTESDVVSNRSGVTTEEELAYGFFVQNDWAVNELLTLSMGARYDSYDFEDVVGTSLDSSQFSPNASLALTPLEGLTLTAGYAQAYRGVGIREAFVPAARPADLDGEEAENYDFTIEYARNGFSASGTYFKQSIDNYLYPVGGSTSYGDIENEGYELAIGYRNGGFSTSLSVTDNSPEVKGYDYPDDIGMVVAGRRWMAEASYAHAGTGLTFGGNIEYREKVDEEAFGAFPAIAGKDSYTVVNAFLRWEVPQLEGLSLTANVDNLFGEQYQDHTIYTASGLASPGREFRLGGTYQF